MNLKNPVEYAKALRAKHAEHAEVIAKRYAVRDFYYETRTEKGGKQDLRGARNPKSVFFRYVYAYLKKRPVNKEASGE